MPILLDRERTYFRVGLDDEATALLLELSEACHCEPAKLIASLVKDVLRDDAQAQAHSGFDRAILDS